MKICFLIIFAVFALAQVNDKCSRIKSQNSNEPNVNNTMSNRNKETTKFDRLPGGIKSDTKIRKDTKNNKGEVVSFEVVTAEQKLNELKAKYDGDKLVDGKGREIKFFEPLCRGVSQGFEEDEKARKEKERELAGLEKKYTVIVLYCDPRNVM
ncbi:MAG: hypothetical protein ACR2MG_12320 [Pyrinomonadaceae bacterium]